MSAIQIPLYLDVSLLNKDAMDVSLIESSLGALFGSHLSLNARSEMVPLTFSFDEHTTLLIQE